MRYWLYAPHPPPSPEGEGAVKLKNGLSDSRTSDPLI
jgi:hypothetical protein